MSELSTPLTPDQQFAMHVYNAGEGKGGGARILQPDIDAPLDPTPNEIYERALGHVGVLFNRNFSAELPDVVQFVTINVDPTTASGLGIDTDGQKIQVQANISNIDLFSRIGFRVAPNGETKIVRGDTFYLRDTNFSHEDVVDGHPRVTHKRLLSAGFRKNPLAEKLNQLDLAYEQKMLEHATAFADKLDEMIAANDSRPYYFVQDMDDAYTEGNEAVRDTILRILGERFKVTGLDDILTANEQKFPNKDGELIALNATDLFALGKQMPEDQAAVPAAGIRRGSS